MDTILKDVPMPKIFLANSIKDDRTYRVVIDGQQRISAILDFLKDRFALETPYIGSESGKVFSQLSRPTKDRFLSYQIDFNEAIGPTDEEVREVYARVNKYTVPLTKQELRRADFPGDFLNISEELAIEEFFDTSNIFTAANRRRYADVEYISELLAGLICGIQDKKDNLDDFYTQYSSWDESHKREVINRFKSVLRDMSLIFNDDLNIAKTRFRQKSDFYTLFLVIDEFLCAGYSLTNKCLQPLREDLRILDNCIRPESAVDVCSEYAIKCVSQANSASSRTWRKNFLSSILIGTYVGSHSELSTQLLYKLMDDFINAEYSEMCPPTEIFCAQCEEEMSDKTQQHMITWTTSTAEKQFSNSVWIHSDCIAEQAHWVEMERPKTNESTVF
tara:strand:- start:8474 stop:9643 length:1170 start_codon:yes stop_codon:yes gene_type:complete